MHPPQAVQRVKSLCDRLEKPGGRSRPYRLAAVARSPQQALKRVLDKLQRHKDRSVGGLIYFVEPANVGHALLHQVGCQACFSPKALQRPLVTVMQHFQRNPASQRRLPGLVDDRVLPSAQLGDNLVLPDRPCLHRLHFRTLPKEACALRLEKPGVSASGHRAGRIRSS